MCWCDLNDFLLVLTLQNTFLYDILTHFQVPNLVFIKYILPGLLTMNASSYPSSTIKNMSPSSPCLTTTSPALQLIVLRASAIYILSYGSISFRISTFDKNYSYFSLFFEAESFTIWLNVFLSKAQTRHSVTTTTEAALGQL